MGLAIPKVVMFGRLEGGGYVTTESSSISEYSSVSISRLLRRERAQSMKNSPNRARRAILPPTVPPTMELVCDLDNVLVESELSKAGGDEPELLKPELAIVVGLGAAVVCERDWDLDVMTDIDVDMDDAAAPTIAEDADESLDCTGTTVVD